MTYGLRLITAAALAMAATTSMAQGGDAVAFARAQGVVGERFDGYLGFAAAPTAQLRRQVGAINITRRSLYTGLATRRGVTVQEVGVAAGCELLAKVKAGESYMLNDGVWRKRSASEAAPVPSYCAR